MSCAFASDNGPCYMQEQHVIKHTWGADATKVVPCSNDDQTPIHYKNIRDANNLRHKNQVNETEKNFEYDTYYDVGKLPYLAK